MGIGQQVSGEVAVATFEISFVRTGDTEDNEAALFKHLRSKTRELHEQIRSEIKRTLGRNFDVDPPLLKRGSVEILVVISAVGATLSAYNALATAIENTRRLIGTFVRSWPGTQGNGGQYRVTSRWDDGLALSNALADWIPSETPPSAQRARVDPILVLLVYLIASYTLLIGVVISVLVRG